MGSMTQVRILAGTKASLRIGLPRALCVGHLARRIIERLFRYAAVEFVTVNLPRLQVDPRELRVVVEHLFKVCESIAAISSCCNPSRLTWTQQASPREYHPR